VVEDVHVELALVGKAREREVAAAEVADDGVDGIGAEQQVKLGMKRMAEEEFHHKLPCLQLSGQTTQTRLVGIGWNSEGQLAAELLGQPLLQAQGRVVVELVIALSQTESGAQLVLR
jgi:hypothetical protein